MSDYFDSSQDRIATGSIARSSQINSLKDSVGGGFDKLPAELDLKQAKATFGVDTGAADAYVITMTNTPTAYADGMDYY